MLRKYLLVKQRDRTDCGAACLASVAAYFGLQLPVSRIRQFAGTNKRGTSLYGLIEAAELLNFQARGARANGEMLSAIPTPAIFHLVLENDMHHFVVVYKIKKKRIIYMDPSAGKFICRRADDFKKSWSGVVLLLVPAENFKCSNERVPVIGRFWQLIQPHRSVLFQALLGAVIYTMLGLSTSMYVQKIVDVVLPDANSRLMNLLSIGMIIVLCFKITIGYFKSLIVLRTGQQIDTRLILGYYKHLLDLPQRFFDNRRVGEIISRVNDALRIRVFINDVAISLVVHALTILLSLSVMFIYYWKLAVFMLLTIPIYLLVYWFSNRMNIKWQRKIMESGAALESQWVETVQGITTIRRFETAVYFNLKTESRFVPFMQAIFISSRNGFLISNLLEWVTGLITIVMLWVGTSLTIDGVMSPGELISFYTLTGFFITPVQALIGSNKPMQEALIAADRLFEILDLETDKGKSGYLYNDHFPSGDLIFNHVHFRYGPGNTVFTDLHVRICQHQMTAIIGESGCGKSTLLSLMQKLYSPDKGNILIGDVNIQYISDPVLRKHIVAVPQQIDLFHGSILSNIALGKDEPDLKSIVNICQRLGLHDFIAQLPDGYQSVVSEQGLNLSGGQKQRLGIARALYLNPSILILDEATSALDPESERKVQETLRWYHETGSTMVIITHRLGTVRNCNAVIFLRQGKAAIYGTHEILITENEEYSSWWNRNLI